MFHLTFAHWLNVWKVRGAAPHLDAARDLVKDDYGMTVSIGYEYRLAGEFDSCVKTFDHAVALKDGGEVRTGRALCRLGLKDEKGALADLQAAVAKEPGYAPAHYYLGGRLAMSKRFKDAAGEYAKYLELAPNGSLAEAGGRPDEGGAGRDGQEEVAVTGRRPRSAKPRTARPRPSSMWPTATRAPPRVEPGARSQGRPPPRGPRRARLDRAARHRAPAEVRRAVGKARGRRRARAARGPRARTPQARPGREPRR